MYFLVIPACALIIALIVMAIIVAPKLSEKIRKLGFLVGTVLITIILITSMVAGRRSLTEMLAVVQVIWIVIPQISDCLFP